MNKQQIEKSYNKLLKDVVTNEFYTKIDLTNRVNCYVCKACQHITKTKDIAAGVTPFMIHCEKCEGIATSSFYKDLVPDRKPTIEWYRPTLKEVIEIGERDGCLDHVLQGGLLSRKYEIPIEPVFHKRESGFQFTQIVIRKIIRNYFVAEFKMKFPNISQVVETSIHSDSVQGCITKVSNFFQTELAPEEVTVKG
jgi:hypothetical protein